MTLKEGIYDIRENLKLLNIDSDTTDRHIVFLMNLFRAVIIRQFFTNNPGEHRDMLTQTLYMELELVDKSRFPLYDTIDSTLLATKLALPNIIGQQLYKEIEVRTIERIGAEVEILHKDRVSEVLYAPKNFIYGFREDDGKLYLFGNSPMYKNLTQITVTAVLEDPESILTIHSSNDDLDIYPITSHLWVTVKGMVVEHISKEMSVPKDLVNDNRDEQEAEAQKQT